MSIHVVVTELDFISIALEASGRCYWGSGFIPVVLEASGRYYWRSLGHWRCVCDGLGSDHIHTVSAFSFLSNISHSLQEQLTVLEASGRRCWGSGFIPVGLEASGRYYWGSLRHWRCVCDALGSDHIHTVSVLSFLSNISHSLQEQLQQFLKRVDDVDEAVSFHLFLKRVGDITEEAWDTDGVYVML